MKKSLIALLLLMFASVSFGAQQIKLATIAPEGTTYGDSLKYFAREVESATKGEIVFRIYYGGVSGDEPDVLRKIRIGQLHGGVFTGKTLGEIHGDVRIMETPFTFYDDLKKASTVLGKLTPEFNQKLKSKGFVGLGFYEMGMVYLVSTKPASNLNELKGIKVWAWEGDELVKAMIESLELVSVPLAITDVLSSLSTGIVNAAYAPPLGILALQWHTKVKHLVDFPTAFSIGALLISDKMWSKIKPEHQKQILAISEKFVKEANTKSVKDNEDARKQLQNAGINFVKFPESDIKQASSVREKVMQKLRVKFYSEKMAQEFEKAVK